MNDVITRSKALALSDATSVPGASSTRRCPDEARKLQDYRQWFPRVRSANAGRVNMTEKTRTSATPSRELLEVKTQSELIAARVAECALDLSAVNATLKLELEQPPSEWNGEIARALGESETIRLRVERCSTDLAAVIVGLRDEIRARAALRAELAESQTQEEEARHNALHDSLTGLPNLTLFNDRLRQGLAQAARHSWRLAVMFLDLDDFKAINDTHGHDVGDATLQEVARRLRAATRKGDSLSRRSGDEFLFLMLEAHDDDAIAALARKFADAVAEPCEAKGVTVSLHASIGAAVYPDDGATPELLLERADSAMYAAKADARFFARYRPNAKSAAADRRNPEPTPGQRQFESGIHASPHARARRTSREA